MTATSSPRAPDRLAVLDPASGAQLDELPLADADDVRAAVARGRAAQPGWAAVGPAERARVLRRARGWLLANAERVVDSIVAETGKTREDARIAELSYTLAALGFWARKGPGWLRERRTRSANRFLLGKRLYVGYRPRGVVGVIGPWNFPLTNSFGDCIPALLAGNAVLLKPSEETPLTSLLMAEMLRASGLPEDVFQVVVGAGDAGAALVDEVDQVMFTGSTATGRRIAEQAARRLIPVGLELGGNDPMIVLADADLERAANGAASYAMFNAGQTCIAIERAYVEDAVHDRFVALLTERVAALRCGPSTGTADTDVGAITSPAQLETIERHVADAVLHGARVLTGGARVPGPGRFYAPTVLADCDHGMEVMREETFGPVLPVMRVADADEAVRLANDSPYGLQASVWTRNVRRGRAIARRLQAGGVSVNDAIVLYTALEAPMGGVKDSGLGVRHGGPDGLRKYCVPQSLLVTPGRWLRHELNMYPNTARRSALMRRAIALLNRSWRPR